MRWDDAASLALALGVGGAVGAALAVSVAGSRLGASFRAFAALAKPYFADKTDSASIAVRESLEVLEAQVQALESSLARLRRSLKSR